MRLSAPGPQFGDLTLGTVAVESPVALGHAAGIARFYETVMQAPATVTPSGEGSVARVKVGPRTDLVFRETAAEIPAYDGHHIAIYISDFSGTHRRLGQRRLISEESNEYQYRFKDIVDPDTGDLLFTLEHEVAVLHSSDVPAAAREPESRAAPADVSARARRLRPRHGVGLDRGLSPSGAPFFTPSEQPLAGLEVVEFGQFIAARTRRPWTFAIRPLRASSRRSSPRPTSC